MFIILSRFSFYFYKKKKKKIKICCANHSFLKTINSIKTRKPTIIGRTRFRVFFSFFFLKRVRYWILENYVHIHKITFEKFVHFPVYFTIYILWVISIFDVKNIIKGGKKNCRWPRSFNWLGNNCSKKSILRNFQ